MSRPPAPSAPAGAPEPAPPAPEALRVLIVDDDEVDRRAVRRALRARGVAVEATEAADVAGALEAMRTLPLDCVFLDFQLPGGDGMRVLREARAAGNRVPIVMLTGQQDEELAVELMKAGATDYIPKARVTAERLDQSLRSALRVARAEEAARRAEAEREAAVAARSRFYAAMSHEIRTPINAILGYTDLLLAGAYGPLPEAQAGGIERAYRAAQHLLELVNDVLDLSKLEAGKLEIQAETVHLPDLIVDLLTTVRPLAEEHGSELRLVDEPGVVPIVSDPRRLRQILLNLLSNALKFGRARPVTVRCAPGAGGGVVVEVVDHGVGIPAADLPRIFEEFVQLHDAQVRGTGLGLPISRGLAELLGGELRAESRESEGSTFRLILPARAPGS